MIDVVGILGPVLSDRARDAVAHADLVVGGSRHLTVVAPLMRTDAATVTIGGDVDPALDVVAQAVGTARRVCVLGSGDPGWFGIVRTLASRFGRVALSVHPAPSSVSEAFARLGLPWDDAAVVSAHGRPATDAARLAARLPKVAVLTEPRCPPSTLAEELLACGAAHEHAAVCARLGTADEEVVVTSLGGLRDGAWDPLSVVVLWSGTGVAPEKSLAWGLPSGRFAHRAAMITKSEVRAVVLGLLALPPPAAPAPVLWDVGAGSGSVAIECARVAPWIDAIAVERDRETHATLVDNVRVHGVGVRAVLGSAPASLASLADPDRIFVGGGGVDVVAAARARLRTDGVVVATFAAMDRAAAAAELLGNLTQVVANRGTRLPDGGWRLEAANPVFVAWGGAA